MTVDDLRYLLGVNRLSYLSIEYLGMFPKDSYMVKVPSLTHHERLI